MAWLTDDTDHITVLVNPNLDGTANVQSHGYWDLGVTLGAGGIVAAMDGYLASRKTFGSYRWRYDPNAGPPKGIAQVIKSVVSFNLKPAAFQQHLWDNLDASGPVEFSAQLERDTTIERSLTWETKLSISDAFTASCELAGGGIKAGASNTVTVSAEVGKTTSSSTTLHIGADDAVTATLQAGQADLVVLTALSGSIDVATTIQTGWSGHWLWQYEGGQWQTMNAQTLEDHGLARPLDPHGTHSGIVTMTASFGAAGRVDQKVESLPDTSQKSIDEAVQRALGQT